MSREMYSILGPKNISSETLSCVLKLVQTSGLYKKVSWAHEKIGYCVLSECLLCTENHPLNFSPFLCFQELEYFFIFIPSVRLGDLANLLTKPSCAHKKVLVSY